MKKLLSTLLCLSAITGIIPTSAGAVSEPIYIEDGAESWSKTVISGDINDDGKLSIADAVILQQCLMNSYSPDDFELDESRLDVNFDGVFDAFDLIQMRQNILDPENAPRQEWAIDILQCEGFPDDETAVVITSHQEMIKYLATFMEDVDMREIMKYNLRYDYKFFEENNLILKPFRQERGNGIFYEVAAAGRMNYADEDVTFNGILFLINPSYEQEKSLYPVTNAPMLAQIAVPKYQCVDGDEAGCLDISHIFAPDISSYSYTSPDGETELYVTQEAFLLGGSVDLYLKNPDGSFTPLTYLSTDDGCCPFNDKGEWFTDNDGNSVFGDRENFTITWKDNGVIIDHRFEGDLWEKKGVTFDGEVTEYPTYNYSYVKWREEEYEIFNNHVYKSPDGEHALYIEQYGDSKSVYGPHTKIEISQKASDGSCKLASTTYVSSIERGIYADCFYPFDQNLTEWSKDDEGNDVISNISETTGEPTFRLTWKEDCVVVEYIRGYNPYPPTSGYSWESTTIKYE
ncbi:MAG: dockerin type I repeat-containing protein [Ruminococcus sp.]|nr:dockerin type I repeat-containing protein [Ruminococcus sp.]